jgi:hypothetical protein
LQYFFNESEHQLRKNVRFNRSTNCFIYFEHSLSDFDDLLLFSFTFFHICSIIFLLLNCQFMKIFRETRLCENLRKLISLICNKIFNNCWWCESRRFDNIMKDLEKNFFSRLCNLIIRIYILSYLDLQNWIFKLFDSKMKIVRIENQHDDFEEDSVVVHCWREKFDIQEQYWFVSNFERFSI